VREYKQIMESAVKDVREELKFGLSECTEGEQDFFKRMYARAKDMHINDVVDCLPEDKLQHAMWQVANTLRKKKQNEPA
jgi:hypothetical protein